jgi:hypothetical protein
MYSNDVTANTDMKWYQIWWHVWTHPGAEAFRTILRDSQASAKRGFLWIAVTSLVSYLVYGISFSRYFSDAIVYLICVLIAPFAGIIGLAISAGIFHFFAGLLGGSGTWEKLVYCFAAISAPASLLSIPASILTTFQRGTFFDPSSTSLQTSPLSCLVSLIGFAAGIYTIVLFVSAIATVENTGTGKAVLIYFIPILVGIALVICLIAVVVIPAIISATR